MAKAWIFLVGMAIVCVAIGLISLAIGMFALIATAASAGVRVRYPDSIAGWTSMGPLRFDSNGALGGVHIGNATTPPTLKDCETACAGVTGCNAVTLDHSVPITGTDINCLFDAYGPSANLTNDPSVDIGMIYPPMIEPVKAGIVAGVSAGIAIVFLLLSLGFKLLSIKYE